MNSSSLQTLALDLHTISVDVIGHTRLSTVLAIKLSNYCCSYLELLVKEINQHFRHRCNIGYDYDFLAQKVGQEPTF